MEERWGFKFESYEDKLKVLGIDFMNEEREKALNLVAHYIILETAI